MLLLSTLTAAIFLFVAPAEAKRRGGSMRIRNGRPKQSTGIMIKKPPMIKSWQKVKMETGIDPRRHRISNKSRPTVRTWRRPVARRR